MGPGSTCTSLRRPMPDLSEITPKHDLMLKHYLILLASVCIIIKHCLHLLHLGLAARASLRVVLCQIYQRSQRADRWGCCNHQWQQLFKIARLGGEQEGIIVEIATGMTIAKAKCKKQIVEIRNRQLAEAWVALIKI
eukprot:1158114-Pelagomonas_calceolata.AAC.1